MRSQIDREDPISLTSGLAREVAGFPTCLTSVPNGSQDARTFLVTLMLFARSSAVASSVEFSDSQPHFRSETATSLPVMPGRSAVLRRRPAAGGVGEPIFLALNQVVTRPMPYGEPPGEALRDVGRCDPGGYPPRDDQRGTSGVRRHADQRGQHDMQEIRERTGA
jgi:hypothetical protein